MVVAKRSWGVLLSCTAVALLSTACGDLDLAGGDADTDGSGGAADDGLTGISTEFSTTHTDDTGPGDTGTPDDDDVPDGGTSEDPGEACDLTCSGVGYCEDLGEGPTCVCPEDYASTGLDCIPCEAIAGGDLPADVPAVDARFSFTISGQLPPTTTFETGDLFLQNTRTGDVADLGRTSDEQSARRLVPGVYDVFYRKREGGTTVPVNTHAKVATIGVVENGQLFEIDVPVATISGSFTVNGATLADAAFNYGRIWLVDEATGDRALLGDTRAQTFLANVVPGQYAVHYEARETQGSAPINRDVRIGSVQVSAASEVIEDFVIDVPVTMLAGALTIDGVGVASGLESGSIQLRDVRSGDRFALGRTADLTYEVAVVPGEYEVLYSATSGGVIAPVNTDHLLRSIVIGAGDTEIDIDVPTAPYQGSITVDGVAPPSSSSDDGVLLLRGDGVDTAYLGNTNTGTFSRRVIPGEYDVFYAQETAGGVMPTNINAMLKGPITLEPGGDVDAQIDIEAIEISGALTIGGNEAPDSPYDDGRIYLRNPNTGDSVLLGNTRLGTYSVRVVPGEYDVVYEAEFSDGVMPLNRAAVLEAGLSLMTTAVHDIDIQVTSVVGDITIDGSTADTSEGVGEIYLRDLAADDLVYLGHSGAPTFERPVLGGRYLAEYHGVASDGATLGSTLPANRQSVFACFDIVGD